MDGRSTDDEFRDARADDREPGDNRAHASRRTVPPLPSDALDLSVVVVFYNMRREAARTLLSLSRSYQRDIEDLDYEVIVVDNGSDPEQRLAEEYVRSFGPEFRYLDLGDDAPPSPTVALNRGAAHRPRREHRVHDRRRARAHARRPAERYDRHSRRTRRRSSRRSSGMSARASRATPCMPGYDQEAEDHLFSRIGWPIDGYRLFEIGHFIGDRDWFDGIVESNCVFVPRKLLERFGAFDDSFAMAGGGYANLDLCERIGSTPGVNVASILGEGSFHQVHGGTTTNIADAAHRRDLVSSYGRAFRELRGRGLLGITKPVHYVGAMATKAAREDAFATRDQPPFDPKRNPVDDEHPQPAAVADELKLAAIEAVWENQTWRDATWLGHRVARYPTDLQSYQELVAAVRPQFVVVAGEDGGLGGLALFFATVLRDRRSATRAKCSRSARVGRRPIEPTHHDGSTTSWVRPTRRRPSRRCARSPGPEPARGVFLGLGAVARVVAAFEAYAPLVAVGSYFVVENTVVNGRPVALGLRPRPARSGARHPRPAPRLLRRPDYERYTLTFNRSGFLKRMS